MKNITLTVNDDLYRHARICAAQDGTTVSALIRDFLKRLHGHEYEPRHFRNEDPPPPPQFP
jgi:hypothetical protein